MQESFLADAALRRTFIASTSHPRFSRYLSASGGDEMRAIAVYRWNTRLSQALYPTPQAWEICLRNRLSGFLSWKYGQSWIYQDQRMLRQSTQPDRARLVEARCRQEVLRTVKQAPSSAVIADLSADFWVSLLSRHYTVPHVWRHNLARIFPLDASLDQRAAWSICNDLLLRNRIAHHEPIFHGPLDHRHDDLMRLIAGMCAGTHAYARSVCGFDRIWSDRP
ncbi:hypothetical protein [uncultured Methylobacterium sp.]|jgi:hypothetical protein|uniref:hypothetical protein n=1 Tax=uncultured Methylobacterium sp. TaxID=157278 RepID=UPI002606DF10|nr:hypothetical protein [uncultured Methylobacterium sp.]